MGSGEPLQILRITSSLYPDKLGGIGLHTHTLSKMQAEAGHDVTVLTSDLGDRSKPRNEIRDNYQILRYREVARPLKNTITPGILTSLLNRRKNYDVVHVHSHLFFTSNVTALLHKLNLFDAPMFITNHGAAVNEGPTILTDIYFPTLGKFTFNVADQVLCYTQTDKVILENAGITAPIKVIHNGINTNLFRPRDEISTDPNQVTYVGMLKRKKGVHHLLRAFDQVQQGKPELRLKIVGDGEWNGKLQEIVHQKNIENVTFTGRIPNEELPEIYNESAVVVLPSESEGLPRVVLEAMSCGTPVITSDLPQLEGVVNQAGSKVAFGKVDELSQSIQQILSNEDKRKTMGENGRQIVLDDYSWKDTVEQTTETYYEVL